MLLETNISIVGGIYHVQVSIIELTPQERQAISRSGMPSIDVAGRIAGSATRPGAASPVAVDVVFPSELRLLPTGFPATGVVAFEDYDDADIIAKVWVTTIIARLVDARDIALSLNQNFVGQTRVTV